MASTSWPVTDRLYLIATPLLRELEKNNAKVRGTVLDVGGPNPAIYKLFRDNISSYYVVNTKKHKCDYADKTLVSDAAKIPLASSSVDTVLCTQVLEHLPEPKKAINEIKRVLKPGGYCLLSTNMAWIYHPDPKDYYRFTVDGLNYLFRDFNDVEVTTLGGFVMALSTLKLLAVSKIPVIGTIYAVLLNLIVPFVDRVFYSDKLTNNLLVVARK